MRPGKIQGVGKCTLPHDGNELQCHIAGVWILGWVENWGHFIIILILHKSLHLSESVS